MVHASLSFPHIVGTKVLIDTDSVQDKKLNQLFMCLPLKRDFLNLHEIILTALTLLNIGTVSSYSLEITLE